MEKENLDKKEAENLDELSKKGYEKISLEQLAEWKSEGNYKILEQHIRQGNLELLPKMELLHLLLLQKEHRILIYTLQKLLLGVQPLLQQEKAILQYIDPNSKMKINFGKIMEELLLAQSINPFSKRKNKTIPMLDTLQNCIDPNALQEINWQDLSFVFKNNQLEIEKFKEFITLFLK